VNVGAHILLPAAAWGEKDGTVTNSERRISRQRAFLPSPGDAKPDWWIVSEVAKRMGYADAFSYTSGADVFREHAALSSYENEGSRDFDIGGIAEISDEEFGALNPIQWPVHMGNERNKTRFFSNGEFFTPDRKGQFIAPEKPATRDATSRDFPFCLNTGRVRDQWHTMTRSGKSPRLGAHLPEPFVEIHPLDAARLSLRDGRFACVSTRYGQCILKVAVSEGQRPGSLFTPIHWSGETASSARVGDLVTSANDPYSGQPEAKATPANITPVNFSSRGFALSRSSIQLPSGTWWASVSVLGGAGYLLATNDSPQFWRAFARKMLNERLEIAEYIDKPRGICRIATFSKGRLETCLFIGPAESVPQWDSVKALFESEALEDQQRRMLLSGKSADGIAATGPVICACFGVGLASIREAITSGAAVSTEEIGKLLRAGTNCGSCLPELKRIVANELVTDRV